MVKRSTPMHINLFLFAYFVRKVHWRYTKRNVSAQESSAGKNQRWFAQFLTACAPQRSHAYQQ